MTMSFVSRVYFLRHAPGLSTRMPLDSFARQDDLHAAHRKRGGRALVVSLTLTNVKSLDDYAIALRRVRVYVTDRVLPLARPCKKNLLF